MRKELIVMKVSTESKIVSEAVRMRQCLTKSSFDMEEIMRIYLATSVSDYFRQDGALGGYVPHQRRLRKRNYFI